MPKTFPTKQLERRLRRAIRGEVRFDNGSRALYSTDSSNYRQIPIGVVIPHTEADQAKTQLLPTIDPANRCPVPSRRSQRSYPLRLELL